MATAARKAAPTAAGVNFLQLDFYAPTAFLPEGDYCLFFQVKHNQAVDKVTGQPKGDNRLGVEITAYDLTNPTEEAKKTQFYGMGKEALLNYAPNPETGKGLVPLPGSSGARLNDSTNWMLFLKSLLDCDPNLSSVLSNDLSVIDGVWVHIQNIPEPESRKNMSSSTSEGQSQPNQPRTVAVVSEIKDNGKPWEGTGGLPTAPVRSNVTITSRDVGKLPTAFLKSAAPAQQPLPPPTTGAVDEEDVLDAAVQATTGVMSKAKNGTMLKIQLKTNVVKHLDDNYNKEIKQAVMDKFFSSDEALSQFLEELNFTLSGVTVKPKA